MSGLYTIAGNVVTIHTKKGEVPFTVVNDKILVLIDQDESKDGEFIIPESERENSRTATVLGIGNAVNVGPDGGLKGLKVLDRVMYRKGGQQAIPFELEGDSVVALLKSDAVDAIIGS